jgi:hypothetical protein
MTVKGRSEGQYPGAATFAKTVERPGLLNPVFGIPGEKAIEQ